MTISQALESMGAMERLLQIQNNYKGSTKLQNLTLKLFQGSSEEIAKNIAGCARKVIQEIKKNVQITSDNAMDIDGPSTS